MESKGYFSSNREKNNDDVYKSLIKFERKVINLNKEVESLKIKVKDKKKLQRERNVLTA